MTTNLTKDYRETVLVDFEFSSDIGTGENIESALVYATLFSGHDVTPSAILAQPCQIPTLTSVHQLVGAGVVGSTYKLVCVATISSGKTLVRKALCEVEQ